MTALEFIATYPVLYVGAIALTFLALGGLDA